MTPRHPRHLIHFISISFTMTTPLNQQDIIHFSTPGFDGAKYITLQKQAILDRMSKFSGRLYLEIGGHFLTDPHASRVLPGFIPDSKKQIFAQLNDQANILFCVNALDIISNRQLSNEAVSYIDSVIASINEITTVLQQPRIVVSMMDPAAPHPAVIAFIDSMKSKGFEVYRRFLIPGYPQKLDTVLSPEGYGKDDYIPLTKNFVIVTGAASNSGKMSTCLGQVYLDHLHNIESGYAKYETFPIRNLPLHHPINIAYEAATADIGDYNTLDKFHKKAYNIESVNYNRDVDAFQIVSSVASKFLPASNFTRSYKSPTDMGINMAGFCLIDEHIIAQACLDEIIRRKARYQEMLDRHQ